MTSEPLFVWVYLPSSLVPVVAGRLEVESGAAGSVGYFTYGRSYLARADAFPLDPVTLPLSATVHCFTTLSGYPGCVLDSAPDRWGMRVIDRMEGARSYPAGYLLMNDPGRSGALAFSSSSADPPQEMSSREFTLLELLAAAESVEAGHEVDQELLRALHPGTGGARPKCNVIDEDGIWIAKFPSLADAPGIDIPRLEHATMRLAAHCGLQVAHTRLVDVGGKTVCLVKRFDRIAQSGGHARLAFLSARSVFYADPAFAAVGTGSYLRLARWMQRYGTTHRVELFRRMVFNVAIRNSDDHELNHGLLHCGQGNFELAPAYDVLPVLAPHRRHRHALLIGDSADGTVTNLISGASAFGIGHDEALTLIADIERHIQQDWRDVFYEAGFDDAELARVAHCFAHIPLK